MSLWIHEPHPPFLNFDYKAEMEIKMVFVVIDPFKPSKISFESRLQSTGKCCARELDVDRWIDDDGDGTHTLRRAFHKSTCAVQLIYWQR